MTEEGGATRGAPRVALVTCADLPELDPDDRPLVALLAQHGVDAQAVVWDDPTVDWAGFDLVVLRSPWDYPDRRAEFLAWAEQVPRLSHPAHLLSWNTDKRYLVELDMVGVPVVPTTWVEPEDRWHPPETGQWVIKPAVGAGSRDAGRYQLSVPEQRAAAVAHVTRLQAAGRVAMVQPYLAAVDGYGESGLVFLASPRHGRLVYSHAIRKGPMLAGPDAPVAGLYRPEQITPRQPTAAELAVARRVLAAVPGGAEALLYARVDLIPGADGRPVLVELEITEPSLFFRHGVGAVERFAVAIAARARAMTEAPAR